MPDRRCARCGVPLPSPTGHPPRRDRAGHPDWCAACVADAAWAAIGSWFSGPDPSLRRAGRPPRRR